MREVLPSRTQLFEARDHGDYSYKDLSPEQVQWRQLRFLTERWFHTVET